MRPKRQSAFRPCGVARPVVEQRAMGYVTIYGNHGGDPRYVLVLDYSASVLSVRDAVQAKRRGIPYQLPGAMTDRERELVHEAWERRDAAA